MQEELKQPIPAQGIDHAKLAEGVDAAFEVWLSANPQYAHCHVTALAAWREASRQARGQQAGGDFEKLATEGGSYAASCGMSPPEALARARELMAGAEDAAILKYALDALTAHFNEFVGACMTPEGDPVAPRKKDLMQARACLPSSCSHGFKPR